MLLAFVPICISELLFFYYRFIYLVKTGNLILLLKQTMKSSVIQEIKYLTRKLFKIIFNFYSKTYILNSVFFLIYIQKTFISKHQILIDFYSKMDLISEHSPSSYINI